MGELDKASVRRINIMLGTMALLLLVIPAFIAVGWILCFISWIGITSWPRILDTNQFLVITGVSLTMPCAIAGLGGMFDWLPLSRTAKVFCGSTVLGGIVLSTMAWLKHATP